MGVDTRVVHIKDKIPEAVYIGRATRQITGSVLGNPFKIGWHGTREQVIDLYRDWLLASMHRYAEINRRLVECRGKPLACWCRHDGEPRTEYNRCHGDVIIEILERFSDEELMGMHK